MAIDPQIDALACSVHNGELSLARQIPSSNCDDRPESVDIDLLVIHSISLPPGDYSGEAIEQFFTNQLNPNTHPYFKEIVDLKVSAHLLIKRCGDVLQFVNLNRRAWHAGQSCFEGQAACNDFSIGIELEGTDIDIFTEQQYCVLANVTVALFGSYPKLSLARIAAHSDIAPDRKTDPGVGFDWDRYRQLVAQKLTTQTV